MSSASNGQSALITSIDQLCGFYEEGIKAPEDRLVGSEHEKFLLRRTDHGVATYEEGVGPLFETLSKRHGYDLYFDGDHPIAGFRKGEFGKTESLTIEPGGQFELSGAPLARTAHTEAELDRHLEEVKAVCDELGLDAIATGANGLHDLDDVPWMPKSRYKIMRAYMPKVGNLGHWMMKMTCTVQANYDYTSEADAGDILRTALWISPIVSALFARSPIMQRRPSGYMTSRCYFWTDTDPQRCGFPLFMMEGEHFGFKDYVKYTLDVPMYLIERDGEYIDMSGRSFLRFIEEGYNGHKATMADYENHISTLFPEVRMKRYIEVRGADCGPREYLLALPALWKGLLYDAESRAAARTLVQDLSLGQRGRLFDSAIRWSLNGPMPGTRKTGTEFAPIRELAAHLVQLSADGLGRMAATPNPLADADEAKYLDPLRQAVDGSTPSPAHALLQRWYDLDGDTAAWMVSQAL